ncbi:MAG: DUF2207 domain-containing protein, partial [Acidimicrobiia bacterium]|nr:DUF2207 domain-containing protein [Acidimicrobiia bacterium]
MRPPSAERRGPPGPQRPPTRFGLLACLALVALLALGALAVHAPAAGAEEIAGEHVRSLDIDFVLDATGDLAVTETLVYDFGGESRRGIRRFIPLRVRYDDTYDRRYDPRDITVAVEPVPGEGFGDAGPAGAVVVADDENDNRVIRVGSETNFITGVWRYTISYRVARTVEEVTNTDVSFQELAWNAVGTEWEVPIAQTSVRFSGPADLAGVRCFTGPFQSVFPCPQADQEGSTASFAAPLLGPGDALTIYLTYPSRTIPDATPDLVERWSFARAFEVTPLKAAVAGVSAAGVSGLLALLLGRQARDRRLAFNAYLPADAEPDRAGLVRFFERPEGPVRFKPPDGATPGLIGVVTDEKADTLDVSATIVDLAVRGYLRIEQIDKKDYRLVKLRDADPALLGYEQTLLGKIFAGRGNTVTLDELRQNFAEDLAVVRRQMYDETMARHWFVRRPDHVRAFWIVVGLVALAAGVAVTVAIALKTHWGLLGLPLTLPGILLLGASKVMPARTGTGRQVLEQAVGYERFLDVADADQLQYQEQQMQFVAGLPYAMVFGLTRKWASVMKVLQERGLDVAPTWYVPMYAGHFDAGRFGDSMSDFSRSAAAALSAPKPTS